MIIPLIRPYRTVILANGSYPKHPVALSLLRNAESLVCCDGATESLLRRGIEPHYIVGDLDSLRPSTRLRYKHCLHHFPDQETNDLTKAVQFCVTKRWTDITILGATGKREDHTLGNISLLADYAQYVNVQLITDYGVFVPHLYSSCYESFRGQKISIFSLTPDTVFTLHGLKYPLGRPISSWWQGTLNEALDDSFLIETENGKALVFREHLK